MFLVIDMGYFVKVLKKLLILTTTLIAIYLTFKLALFYIPFLIGFIISLLIEPLIKFINKKLPKKQISFSWVVFIFNLIFLQVFL